MGAPCIISTGSGLNMFVVDGVKDLGFLDKMGCVQGGMAADRLRAFQTWKHSARARATDWVGSSVC